MSSAPLLLDIHPTAVIEPGAELGRGVTIGPYAVIGRNVRIGDRTRIGAHAVIDGWTDVGRSCEIHAGAVVGGPPQDLKHVPCRSFVQIGDATVIRELATVNRATGEDEATVIGSEAYVMIGAHVAHNCAIGDHVILANAVQLGGYVAIEEWAAVGGGTAVHQFVRIGRHSFVGGASRVVQDVPPYVLAAGNPLEVAGVNVVGLARRGFPRATLRDLKEAFRLLYRADLNLTQAVARMRTDGLAASAEVGEIVRFLEDSKRGITR